MLNLEEQIFKQIADSQNPLIVLPAERSGGSLATGLAFYLFLKKLNKKIKIVADSGLTPNFGRQWSFLPAYNEIGEELKNLRKFVISVDISQSKVSQIKYTIEKNKLNFIVSPESGWLNPQDVSSFPSEFKYDLIIVLGAIDLEALGKIYDNNIEFFYKTTIINIDHHPGNEEFGQINFIDLNVVSTAEIIYYLCKNYQTELIDEDIATCLLAGIIADSKNFKTNNLTPRTLLATSQLIDLNGRREEIVNHLYRSRSFEALKLWGKLLNNLKTESAGKLVWSKLSPEDFQTTNSSETELAEIIDELILNLNETFLLTIVYQIDPKGPKQLIIHALKNINALKIGEPWQARGNSKRSLAILDIKNPDHRTDNIIDKLNKQLAKILS